VFQGVVYHLVKGGKTVKEAGGKPGGRVSAAVALHAEVQVGKMEDFQPLPL